MILGIAGTIGAGKGTVVEYLKTKGFAHFSASGTLWRILEERGLPTSREHSSALANELLEKYTGGIIEMSHVFAKESKEPNYILESIHRVREAEYVKSIGGIILGIDADVEVRYERAHARKEGLKDDVTFEQFLADSEREDEGKTGSGPNIKAVIRMADYTIMNDGTIEELETKIETFLQSLKD